MNDRQVEPGQRVTPLELFFDLVFVFGITQVTGFLADNPTWGGLLPGLMLLGALWWAWAAYAWLTNTLNPRCDISPLTYDPAAGLTARRGSGRIGGQLNESIAFGAG